MLDRPAPDDFRERLADLVRTLRPEWDRLHVVTALEQAERRNVTVTLGQFTAAVVNVAHDREWRTPRGIAYDGPHWPAGAHVGTSRDAGPSCLECGRPERLCRMADARVHPADRHQFRSTR